MCLNKAADWQRHHPKHKLAIVRDVEAWLTHETLHVLLDELGEDGLLLDNIETWHTMKDWIDPPEEIRWKDIREQRQRAIYALGLRK